MELENSLQTPEARQQIEQEFFYKTNTESNKKPLFSSLSETLEEYVGDDFLRAEIENSIQNDLGKRMNGMFVNTSLPFQEAKEEFEKNYIQNHLMLNLGIKSEVQRKTGMDDKTLDRKIDKYGIDMGPYDIMNKDSKYHKEPFRLDPKVENEFVKIGLNDALKKYEYKYDIDDKNVYEKLQAKIPEIASKLTQEINHQGKNPIVKHKDAMKYFEKEYLTQKLGEYKNPVEASKYIDLGKSQIYKKASDHGINLKEARQNYESQHNKAHSLIYH